MSATRETSRLESDISQTLSRLQTLPPPSSLRCVFFVSARSFYPAEPSKPARTNGRVLAYICCISPTCGARFLSAVPSTPLPPPPLPPHFFSQQPHTAPCCVTCLTAESQRSGAEASICTRLIIHPPALHTRLGTASKSPATAVITSHTSSHFPHPPHPTPQPPHL